MSAAPPSCAVQASLAAFRLLLCLYPARTRRLYGKELIDIARIELQDAYARGGNRHVARLWPRLLADSGVALAAEHLDLWRSSRFGPARFACACLLVSAFVWTLVLAASIFDAGWASKLLNFNLTVTAALAFGLPAAALGASHLRAPEAHPRVQCAAPLRLSTAATIAAWSALALHLA